jgi:hypothetical protein
VSAVTDLIGWQSTAVRLRARVIQRQYAYRYPSGDRRYRPASAGLLRVLAFYGATAAVACWRSAAAVQVAELGRQAGVDARLGMLGRLRTLVPRQRAAELFGQCDGGRDRATERLRALPARAGPFLILVPSWLAIRRGCSSIVKGALRYRDRRLVAQDQRLHRLPGPPIPEPRAATDS